LNGAPAFRSELFLCSSCYGDLFIVWTVWSFPPTSFFMYFSNKLLFNVLALILMVYLNFLWLAKNWPHKRIRIQTLNLFCNKATVQRNTAFFPSLFYLLCKLLGESKPY
jgi:hypothetical protein